MSAKILIEKMVLFNRDSYRKIISYDNFIPEIDALQGMYPGRLPLFWTGSSQTVDRGMDGWIQQQASTWISQ